MTACQTDFVAVVYTRCAKISQLEEQRQTQGGFVLSEDSKRTRRIVAAQESELDGSDLWTILALEPRNDLSKLFGTELGDLFVGALMNLLSIERVCRDKAKNRPGQLVVHHRVELIALQPAT